MVTHPVCEWSASLPRMGCAASTLDALSRNSLADPAHTNVRAMMGLVDMVLGFGPEEVGQTLGHPEVLQRVEAYVSNFPCPECHPWEFGMSRMYLAMVLGMGADLRLDSVESVDASVSGERVAGAKALLQRAREAVEGRKGVVGVSFPPQTLAEVLGAMGRTEASIAMGRDHPWYW